MIDKLAYLLALAREAHFGRAAESCGVTQPTFSAGIRALEEALNMPLVERSSRFRGFTPEGERVLEWARQIIGDVQAMRADLRALKGGMSGLLRFAVIPTALTAVTDLTIPYHARYPDVRLSIQSCTSNEVLRRLDNFEVDIGITYLNNEPTGRNRVLPLYQEHYHLLTTAKSPLGRRKTVTWAEIGQVPLGLLTSDMQNRRIINRLLHSTGAGAPPVLESNSVIVLINHVQAGLLSCVLPEMLIRLLGPQPGLRTIPIVAPEETHMVGLILPERDPVSPLVSALIALVQSRPPPVIPAA